MLLTRLTDRARAASSHLGRLTLAALVVVLGALGISTPALASGGHHHARYQFTTLDNSGDLTFNQLLGINNRGLIAGYFGSGAQGSPNQGYLLGDRWGQARYLNENFPGSVQTQVTGLNDRGVTVGFYSDMNTASQVNDNFGFYALGGRFHAVNFPTTDNATPPVNQLLGVNDRDIAVGFYTDSATISHGYTYDIRSGAFTPVTVPGATSVTAAAINNRGDIAGSETVNGTTDGFLLGADGQATTLAYPGADSTQAFGVNDRDEVVGLYMVGSATHGFTWTPQAGFRTVDDPNGIGTTTINGVNDSGDLVGFYTDANGNTDGMLAVAHRGF
jgi:hypothetical protein